MRPQWLPTSRCELPCTPKLGQTICALQALGCVSRVSVLSPGPRPPSAAGAAWGHEGRVPGSVGVALQVVNSQLFSMGLGSLPLCSLCPSQTQSPDEETKACLVMGQGTEKFGATFYTTAVGWRTWFLGKK